MLLMNLGHPISRAVQEAGAIPFENCPGFACKHAFLWVALYRTSGRSNVELPYCLAVGAKFIRLARKSTLVAIFGTL